MRVFRDSIESFRSDTDFANLPENVLLRIAGHFEQPHDLLTFSHTCSTWRALAGRHKSWVNLLRQATMGVQSLREQLTIWRNNELSIDAQPLRYYNLYLMLSKHAQKIVEIQETKNQKKKNLKKLNLIHLKQLQRERRFRKIESSQRELFKQLMQEMMTAFQTNPTWRNHLMKEYREMYVMNRTHHVEKMNNVKFLKASELADATSMASVVMEANGNRNSRYSKMSNHGVPGINTGFASSRVSSCATTPRKTLPSSNKSTPRTPRMPELASNATFAFMMDHVNSRKINIETGNRTPKATDKWCKQIQRTKHAMNFCRVKPESYKTVVLDGLKEADEEDENELDIRPLDDYGFTETVLSPFGGSVIDTESNTDARKSRLSYLDDSFEFGGDKFDDVDEKKDDKKKGGKRRVTMADSNVSLAESEVAEHRIVQEKMMINQPIMFVAFFEFHVMEFPWLNLHLSQLKDWECMEIQYNSYLEQHDQDGSKLAIGDTWGTIFERPSKHLANLRGCQCIRSWNQRSKPTLVVPAGHNRFAVGYRNGAVQLLRAARKPSLHVEQVLQLQTEPGMVSAMKYVGDRFNLLIVGSWTTNVVVYSCSSMVQKLEINAHNDTIVALDFIITASNKFLLLSASRNGRITIHEIEFHDKLAEERAANAGPPSQASKMCYDLKSVELKQMYLAKEGEKLKNACLVGQHYFAMLNTCGILTVVEVKDETSQYQSYYGIGKLRLKTACQLPIVHMVSHVERADGKEGPLVTTIYCSVASGLLYQFSSTEIQTAMRPENRLGALSFTSQNKLRISGNQACQLYPSSANNTGCQLIFVDPDLDTIFTQFRDGGSSSVFPMRRTLVGHTKPIISVASVSTAMVSLCKEGDLLVWFCGYSS